MAEDETAYDPASGAREDADEPTRAVAEEPGETRVAASEEDADPRSTVYGSEPTPSEIAVPPRAPATPRHGLAPGTVLFGEYEIVDVLGAGGMGEVYRARHRRLGETRAIKVMHPNVASDPRAAELFDREAKALLSVRHEAVVNCHDLLSDAEGRVYLVMEMIDGISLADRIRSGGALPVDEVQTLARRVGSGLAAAHARGVIHRDLSPDNIILPGGRAEHAKLIDFGIAKVLASGQQTILEGFKGKLGYASPEQLGFFDGRIDGRSDVYSLGLVLYAAATGAALPMGSSVVEAVDARRQRTGVPNDCPAALRADIDAMLALHPEDRPATLDGRFGAGAAAPRPAPAGAERRGWGRPALLGAAAVALAGLAAAAVIALRPAGELDAQPVAVVGVRETGPAPTAAATVEVVAAVKPPEPAPAPAAAPAPRRADRVAGAKGRLRVMGLLRGAQNALERDALTTPPGDNAYDKFREVLSLDAGNREAKSGIQATAARCIQLARESLERGDLTAADGYLAQARKVSPRHPDLAAAVAAAAKQRAGG